MSNLFLLCVWLGINLTLKNQYSKKLTLKVNKKLKSNSFFTNHGSNKYYVLYGNKYFSTKYI